MNLLQVFVTAENWLRNPYSVLVLPACFQLSPAPSGTGKKSFLQDGRVRGGLECRSANTEIKATREALNKSSFPLNKHKESDPTRRDFFQVLLQFALFKSLQIQNGREMKL